MHVFLTCLAVVLAAMIVVFVILVVIATREAFQSARKNKPYGDAVYAAAFMASASVSSVYLFFLVLSFL